MNTARWTLRVPSSIKSLDEVGQAKWPAQIKPRLLRENITIRYIANHEIWGVQRVKSKKSINNKMPHFRVKNVADLIWCDLTACVFDNTPFPAQSGKFDHHLGFHVLCQIMQILCVWRNALECVIQAERRSIAKGKLNNKNTRYNQTVMDLFSFLLLIYFLSFDVANHFQMQAESWKLWLCQR